MAISVLFSADAGKKIFLLALLTVALTLILGRFFCGWVCPLGSLNQCIAYLHKRLFRRKRSAVFHPAQKIKYLILIFVIVLAIFGVNLTGLTSPLVFLSRTITPVFHTAASGAFRFIQFLNTRTRLFANDRFFYAIQAYINYFSFPVYRYAAIATFSLVLVLLLNLIAPRFWCRFVCPLGGLLGFISRRSILHLRQSAHCSHCLGCARNCQGACDPHKKGNWIKQECLYCMNCLASCPEQNLKFRFHFKSDYQKVDLTRRQMLYSAGGAILALPLIKLGIRRCPFNPHLIRPPGAVGEDGFLKRCIRCSACIKVCPTNFLQPALFAAGIYGIWTPQGVGGMGYCKYNCNLCGRACPSGALKNLSLREKQRFKIGTAVVDKSRCRVYAQEIPCLLCYKNCPLPGKAIEPLEIEGSKGLWGPRVISDQCLGCAKCAHTCPAGAIYVVNSRLWL